MAAIPCLLIYDPLFGVPIADIGYYGNLDGSPALWGFLALGNYCDPGNAFSGTRILPVKIALTTPPPSCP